MSAAKSHHVLKLLSRHTANLAEAVGSASATTSSLPPTDPWKGLSDSMKPVPTAAGPALNPGAASFPIHPVRTPVTSAPSTTWSTTSLRAGPAPALSVPTLPLPHLSPSIFPIHRYLDHLRLAQNLHSADDDPPPYLHGDRTFNLVPLAAPTPPEITPPPTTQQLQEAAPSSQSTISTPLEPTAPPRDAPASSSTDRPHGLTNTPPQRAADDKRVRVLNQGLAARQQLLPHQGGRPQLQRLSTGSSPAASSFGRRPARAASSAVHLNKEIMAATSTTQLLALVRSRGAQMDFFNISSAISRTPKLAGLQGGCETAAGLPVPQHPSLDSDSRQLAGSLAMLMCDKIGQFDARGLANSAWAFGKLRYVPSPALPALIASEAVAKMDGFCAQNISNLAWAFVYMHHRDERVLAAMAKKICSKLEEFKPQELANVLWAFASLEYPDPDMTRAATEQAARIAPLFKEQELSNAIWAMGRLQYYSPQVFSSLLAVAASKLHHFQPQGVANIAWAMASLGHRDAAMMHKMAQQCRGKLAAFDMQALSHLAWSFASLGFYDVAFMQELVAEGLHRLERLSPHNLSNLLWTCAELGHQDPRMLAAWSQQVAAKLPSFEPQAVASLVRSFHRLGHSDPALYAALAGAVAAKADSCSLHDLLGAAKELAGAGQQCGPLLEKLASRLTAELDSCGAGSCATALWTLASLNHYEPELYEALLRRLLHSSGPGAALDPEAVAHALWACARVGHAPSPHTFVLASHALPLMPAMSWQQLSDTMWAMASMQLLDAPTFQLISSCLQQQADQAAAAEGAALQQLGAQVPQAVALQQLQQLQQQAQGGAAGAQAPFSFASAPPPPPPSSTPLLQSQLAAAAGAKLQVDAAAPQPPAVCSAAEAQRLLNAVEAAKMQWQAFPSAEDLEVIAGAGLPASAAACSIGLPVLGSPGALPRPGNVEWQRMESGGSSKGRSSDGALSYPSSGSGADSFLQGDGVDRILALPGWSMLDRNLPGGLVDEDVMGGRSRQPGLLGSGFGRSGGVWVQGGVGAQLLPSLAPVQAPRQPHALLLSSWAAMAGGAASELQQQQQLLWQQASGDARSVLGSEDSLSAVEPEHLLPRELFLEVAENPGHPAIAGGMALRG